MGEPSAEQIDEAIARGLANRWSEARILRHLLTLERMTDEDLAAMGIFPPPPKAGSASPQMSPPRDAARTARPGSKVTKWRK